MLIKIKTLIRNYKAKWLLTDFIFISDMIANSFIGAKYYEIFTYWGIPGEVVNTIVSILELVRIIILIYEKHQSNSTDL